jgi:hypothetical protein
MKKTMIILLGAVITLSSCNSGPSVASSVAEIPKSPEELKMDLITQEEAAPLTYLKVDGTMSNDEVQTRSEGLFHAAEYSPDGNTIHGTIVNSATLAKFKDVKIIVTYYSQTDTPISTEEKIFYEFYTPNSNTPFELKVYPPEDMAKFGLEVKSAAPSK